MSATDVVTNNASWSSAPLVAVDNAQSQVLVSDWFFTTARNLFAGQPADSSAPLTSNAPVLGIDTYGRVYQAGTQAQANAAQAAIAPIPTTTLLLLAGLAFLLLRK